MERILEMLFIKSSIKLFHSPIPTIKNIKLKFVEYKGEKTSNM